VPWLRDNYGHSSTKVKKKKAVPQYTGLREPTGAARAIRDPENMVLGYGEWTRVGDRR